MHTRSLSFLPPFVVIAALFASTWVARDATAQDATLSSPTRATSAASASTPATAGTVELTPAPAGPVPVPYPNTAFARPRFASVNRRVLQRLGALVEPTVTLNARTPYVEGRASVGIVVGHHTEHTSQGGAGASASDNFFWFQGDGWDLFSGLYLHVKQTPHRVYRFGCGVVPTQGQPLPTVDVVFYGNSTSTRTVSGIGSPRVLDGSFSSGEASDERIVQFRVHSGAPVRFTDCQVTGYEAH